MADSSLVDIRTSISLHERRFHHSAELSSSGFPIAIDRSAFRANSLRRREFQMQMLRPTTTIRASAATRPTSALSVEVRGVVAPPSVTCGALGVGVDCLPIAVEIGEDKLEATSFAVQTTLEVAVAEEG